MIKTYDTDPPVSSFGLGDALKRVGLLPPGCVSVEILAQGYDEAIRIRYEVYVMESDMGKLAEAFALVQKGTA